MCLTTMAAAGSDSVRRSIEAIWRIESPKLVAALVRFVRDISLAEDVAQEALLVALETWPRDGIPDNPGAWLMTAAKRRAVDHWRHERLLEKKREQNEQERMEPVTPAFERLEETNVGDDLLRLMFIACHPLLSTEARIALTLRLLGGLTTDEIARAFLQPEATIAQRIVRAKKKLGSAGMRFELPGPRELAERLDSVLEVVYLIFNEGYSATRGEDLLRPSLSEEALRLGRVLAELAPKHSSVHALLALMEIQASRFNARINEHGEPILLENQDRSKWDRLLIRRGLAALERARSTASIPGSYLLQAEIAACHARAPTAEDTDWKRIAMFYELLGQVAPSPIVELNRAVAVSMAFGPQSGLDLLDRVRHAPLLKSYHLLPSVRGDFLFRLKRFDEARAEFARAAELAGNDRERVYLETRIAACAE